MEGLSKGGLGWAWGATVWTDLSPAFAEEVAEFPTGLNSRAEQFFVRWLAFSLVLTEAEKHLSEGPAGAEEGVGFAGKLGALFHETVAEGDVEVEGAFSECFRKRSVVGIVQVVVQLKADSQY